ncbi:MAG: hypothetical protein WCD11_08205 [Solirubrobacteraceae bacterium]
MTATAENAAPLDAAFRRRHPPRHRKGVVLGQNEVEHAGRGVRRAFGVTVFVHGNVASFAFRGALEDPFKYMIWYGRAGSIIRRIG